MGDTLHTPSGFRPALTSPAATRLDLRNKEAAKKQEVASFSPVTTL